LRKNGASRDHEIGILLPKIRRSIVSRKGAMNRAHRSDTHESPGAMNRAPTPDGFADGYWASIANFVNILNI
jgi:hypothetical protein